MTPAPTRRLVIDNDWAGDPDGLVALAHHLLSSDRVDLITSSLTSPDFPGSDDGARRGAHLVRGLLAVIGSEVEPAIAVGAENTFSAAGPSSDASRAIIDEALRDDALPLVVVCAGPLTNVAAALRDEPAVMGRFRLVWVGGSTEGDTEYNESTDREAAAAVFASGLTIDQFPLEVYRECRYSVSELESDLGATPVGEFLWRAFVTLPLPPGVGLGEVWHLGDSLPLLATTLATDHHPARRHVHDSADFRLIVGDMLAKFRMHASRLRDSAAAQPDGRT